MKKPTEPYICQSTAVDKTEEVLPKVECFVYIDALPIPVEVSLTKFLATQRSGEI